jgi:adenylate cyclase
MAYEIERKFLLKNDTWRQEPDLQAPVLIRQGYLSCEAERTVRIRQKGTEAFLTIKGKAEGLKRLEFEYAIPVADAEQLFSLCVSPPLEKKRYLLPAGELCWEIDEFLGVNQGLCLAELEMPSEDTPFNKSSWLAEEVSQDFRYTNAYLAQHPFTLWKPNS